MRMFWKGRDVGDFEDDELAIADRMMAIDEDAAAHTAAGYLVECEFHYDFAFDLATGCYAGTTRRDWVSYAVYEAQARLRDRTDDEWNDFTKEE